MIKSRTKRTLLAAALALGLPTAALAQTPAPTGAAAPSEQEMQAWFEELQQLHEQLEGIQIEALQDPQLTLQQEQLGEEIQLAMEVVDPMMDQRMSRIQSLEAEAMAAQQQGDSQRLQQLVTEAQQIQQHFMMVQESALAEPEIAAKVADFQTQLEQRMIELDPAAEALITRFRELEVQIEAAMTGGL